MDLKSSKTLTVLLCILALMVGFLLAQFDFSKTLLAGREKASDACPSKEAQATACPKPDFSADLLAIRAKLFISPDVRFSGKIIADINEISADGLVVSYDSQKTFPLDEGVVQKTVQVGSMTFIGKFIPPKSAEQLRTERAPTSQESNPDVVEGSKEAGAIKVPKIEKPAPPADFSTSPFNYSDFKIGDKVLIMASNDFRQEPTIIAQAIVLVNGATDQDLTQALNTTTLPSTPSDEPGKEATFDVD